MSLLLTYGQDDTTFLIIYVTVIDASTRLQNILNNICHFYWRINKILQSNLNKLQGVEALARQRNKLRLRFCPIRQLILWTLLRTSIVLTWISRQQIALTHTIIGDLATVWMEMHKVAQFVGNSVGYQHPVASRDHMDCKAILDFGRPLYCSRNEGSDKISDKLKIECCFCHWSVRLELSKSWYATERQTYMVFTAPWSLSSVTWRIISCKVVCNWLASFYYSGPPW